MQMCSWIVDLRLIDIMANLSSTVYCEVLLKSRELCCVSIEVDFCFGLQQERLCKTDLKGLQSSLRVLPTHALNYCVQK